jgi:type I restriction enzyme S subunit
MISKKLKNITSKIGSGATPRGGQNSYFTEGITLIRSQNVLDFDFTKNGLAFINEEQAKELNNVTVLKNDILLNITGDSIARCCIVPEDVLPARVNQHVAIIRCNETVNHKYVFYYLQYIKPYLLKICGVGGTRNALTKEVIENLDIQIHLNQNEIAEILFTIDSKIQLNKKINTELENLAKTIYNYWFVQFDFPNKEGKPYKTSGGEMVWNEELKREIPKGWEVFLLKEKLEFERGVEPGSDKYFEKQIDETLIPFFKVGGMNGDTDVWIKKDDAKGAICCEEDILLSLDGSVGRIAIGLSGAYSSGIRKVYPKNGNFPKSYIYFLLHSDEIQQTIKKNATGSNILHAAKALDYMMAPYNANVVESFDKLCNPIFNKILATKKENQELIKLRDFLLPLLMNGQVKVKSEATEQLSMAAEPQVKYGK